MSDNPVLQWIHAPVQGRSERTLARLFDATERLLETRSFDRITVADIVREADASVGSFYARFNGKDALLHGLWARYCADGRATAADILAPERWAETPLRGALEVICAFVVERERAERGLRRAVLLCIPNDEHMRTSAAELTAHTISRLAALLESKVDEMTHPDPLLAADIIHRVLFSVLDQIHVFHPVSPTGRVLSDEELARELTRALCGVAGLK